MERRQDRRDRRKDYRLAQERPILPEHSRPCEYGSAHRRPRRHACRRHHLRRARQ